jgi:hypothetical protein
MSTHTTIYGIETINGADPQVCLTYTDSATAVADQVNRWEERGDESEELAGKLAHGPGIVLFGPTDGYRTALVNPARDDAEQSIPLATMHLFDTDAPTAEQVAEVRSRIAEAPVYKPHVDLTGDRRLVCVATIDPAPTSTPEALAVRAAYTPDQMEVALMHMVERSEVSTTHQRQAERQAAIRHGNGFAGFEHADGCRSILADPVRCHTRQAAAYLYDTPVATAQQHEALLEVMFAEGSPNPDHFDIHTEKLPEWIGPAIYTDDAIYIPVAFADGQMGYAVNSPTGGRQEFIYLNPSSETDDGKPNVFLYHGPVGNPVDDAPQHHYLVLVDEGQEGAQEPPGFSLSIELGDGEMQTGEHVASVLQTLADHLRESGGVADENPVRDTRGNTVGRWSLVLPEQPELSEEGQ